MSRRKTYTLADVQATLDLHVAHGTVEKCDDGSYANVPVERLTFEQLKWHAAQMAREDPGFGVFHKQGLRLAMQGYHDYQREHALGQIVDGENDEENH